MVGAAALAVDPCCGSFAAAYIDQTVHGSRQVTANLFVGDLSGRSPGAAVPQQLLGQHSDGVN